MSTSELEIAPYPLMWLRARSNLVTREACKRSLALWQSVSDQVFPVYVQGLWEECKVEGDSADGRNVVQWLSAVGVVAEHHHSLMGEALALSFEEPNFQQHVERNEEDSADLLSWFLLYEWFTSLFGGCLMCNIKGPDPDERRPILEVKNVPAFAMGFSNASMPVVWNGLSEALTASLLGMAYGSRSWDAPPWTL